MTCATSKHGQRRHRDHHDGECGEELLASAMAQGRAGPEDYVPHLVDFIAKANGVR